MFEINSQSWQKSRQHNQKLTVDTINMQQTISILNTKVHPEWGKTGNWDLLWFLSAWWEILPCILPQRPKLRGKKKKKGGASKHFNDENKRETSTPDLWLLQNLRGQTQSLPVTSSPPFFWFGGWFWLLVVGFWFGVFFFKRYLLLALRHSTTPAGYKLWWTRSTTLRAQNLFLIW